MFRLTYHGLGYIWNNSVMEKIKLVLNQEMMKNVYLSIGINEEWYCNTVIMSLLQKKDHQVPPHVAMLDQTLVSKSTMILCLRPLPETPTSSPSCCSTTWTNWRPERKLSEGLSFYSSSLGISSVGCWEEFCRHRWQSRGTERGRASQPGRLTGWSFFQRFLF